MLAASLAASVVPAVLAQAQESAWRELRDEDFVLRARLPAGEVDAIACDLRRAAHALHTGMPEAFASGEWPGVFAVSGTRETRELLPQYWEGIRARPTGASWSGPHGHHIVVRVDVEAQERQRRILHEYAHFATRRADENPPVWLEEGLAEFWEATTFAGDEMAVGGPVERHLRVLRRKKWMPMDRLLSAAAVPSDTEGSTLFYAQSWALVHYLASEASGPTRVDDIGAVAAGVTEGQLKGYVTDRLPDAEARSLEVPRDLCNGASSRRVLTETESLVFRARAVADGERPDAAAPLLHRALALQPDSPEALEVLGFVHFAGNRPKEAAAAFDRVIASGAASHLGYYYRALLAGAVPERGGGAGPVPVLEYLRRAVRLNPAFAPARERLRALEGKFDVEERSRL